MSNERKRGFGWIKILLLGAIIGLGIPATWMALNYRPTVEDGEPLVAVSPETTRITEPLDENGDVDFLEAINLRLSKGISPETNAAVFYVRAIGPSDIGPAFEEEFLERLGIDASQYCETPFLTFEKWAFDEYRREYGADVPVPPFAIGDMLSEFEYLTGSTAQPWSEMDFPATSKWMEANTEAIALVRQATNLEKFYYPLVSDSRPAILGAKLPHLQSMRDLARFFSVSAIRHLHEDNIELFIEDLRCMDQMGQHASQGSTLIERLIAISIKRKVLDRIVLACATERNAEDLQQLQAFVDLMDETDSLAKRIDETERLMILDTTVAMGRGHSNGMFGGFSPGMVDWEETLRLVNSEFDRVVESTQTDSHTEFCQRCKEAEDRLRSLEVEVSDGMIAASIGGRAAKGKWTGKLMASSMMPAFNSIGDAEARLRCFKEMARLAVAVTAFRKDSGQLPEELQQLSPKYMDRIPVDPFSDKPFVLTKTDSEIGFRIQSPAWQESPTHDDLAAEPIVVPFEDTNSGGPLEDM